MECSVRFEASSTDHHLLDTLFAWKDAQCARTGVPSLFSLDWPRRLVHRLLDHREPELTGMLSAVYLGDSVAAIHFGMRSRHVLHWHFTAYDPSFSKFSPGAILLVRVMQEANAMGITRIDLGKGTEPYKQRFATGIDYVCEGSVDTRPLTGVAWNRWLRLRQAIKNSRFRSSALHVNRWICNTRTWMGYAE
jgi:CelD/BcsL family acetyltransferase involved in cellulose biosynthesis